jgi:hypothetical protein
MKDIQQLTWILFCQKCLHSQRMLIPQLTRSQSQFNTEQSNEMARCHPSPLILFLATIMEDPNNEPESCFVKRDNTHGGC